MSENLSLFDPPPDNPGNGGAYISECGRYRYALWRQWWSHRPLMVFIMLNPSTADALEDDPTIRRCMGFARREDYGGILVLNLFAWRATNPKELVAVEDPVGPENNAHFFQALSHPDVTPIVAWGALHKSLQWREDEVKRLLERARCLGTTKAGHPRHPLYLPGDAPLQEWGK